MIYQLFSTRAVVRTQPDHEGGPGLVRNNLCFRHRLYNKEG